MKELIQGRDYEVVDEGLGSIADYLERTSRNAFLHFASLINSATSGRRGKYATIALNMANVTTNKEEFSRIYEQNSDVIDDYFEYVDVIALSKKLEVDQMVASNAPKAILKTGGLLAAGIVLGVAGLKLYNRKK
ncbi:hypothetical protein IQ255_25915 [Pleurocapsales cyanobacterium LEGE 10410]|nr:hypothetical protein [Pleurocapsales cyanobacterium LEGE 10410]